MSAVDGFPQLLARMREGDDEASAVIFLPKGVPSRHARDVGDAVLRHPIARAGNLCFIADSRLALRPMAKGPSSRGVSRTFHACPDSPGEDMRNRTSNRVAGTPVKASVDVAERSRSDRPRCLSLDLDVAFHLDALTLLQA
jgi:hypothetical protein